MATQQPPASPPPPPPKPAAPAPAPVKATHGATGPPQNEIVLYSHSNLFDWWPVWAMAFILGCLTAFEGHVLAVVPNHSEYKTVAVSEKDPKTGDKREVEHHVVDFPEGKNIKDALEHQPR